MGIFGRKKPKTVECDACGLVYTPGVDRPHEYTHIAKISRDEPPWLPAHMRNKRKVNIPSCAAGVILSRL